MSRRASFCAAFAATFLLGTGLAAGQTFTGHVGTGDPTMHVVFISTPHCTGQGSTEVGYDVYPFVVSQTGFYTLRVTSDGQTSIYLFEDSFNPAAAFGDCIAASNSGNPKELTVELTAGTQYFAVPFNDAFSQEPIGYELVFSGPRPIILQAVSTLTQWSYILLALGLVLASAWHVRRRAAGAAV